MAGESQVRQRVITTLKLISELFLDIIVFLALLLIYFIIVSTVLTVLLGKYKM